MIVHGAGRNHKNARNLQVSHGANFLMQPTVANAIDLKSCGIGRGDSDFRGCYDMRNAAVAMEAEASLLFDEVSAFQFQLALTLICHRRQLNSCCCFRQEACLCLALQKPHATATQCCQLISMQHGNLVSWPSTNTPLRMDNMAQSTFCMLMTQMQPG